MRVADVSLPVRVDASTSSDIRYALTIAIDGASSDVVVDASAVESIDVAGLGVLVSAHRRARQLERRLVLCGMQPRLMRLFAVTRLHRMLDLEHQVEPAV